MWLIFISCSLKPINTSDRIKSEWFNLLVSVWTLCLLIIPSHSHDGSVTYLPTREKVTMTSALHGWQVVLARFEQRRQRVENHEARVSSLRLVVANHDADFSNVPKLRTRSSSSLMLYEMSRKEPLCACTQSSLFCLLSAEGWVFYEIQTRQINRLLCNRSLLQFGGFISKWCSSTIEVFPIIP